MAMNIAKLQAQLQHIPDQTLIGYVQNPQGEVPSYLALAELSRRKEIRNAAPKQASPTQSVAAKELSQIQPGIPALPLPESMFQEKSMATGGIVAFDQGGDVKHYATGDYVVGDYNYADQYRKARQLAEAERVRAAYNQTPGEFYSSSPSTPIKSPYDAALAYYGAQLDPENPQASKAYDAFMDLKQRQSAWLAGQKDPFTGASPVGSAANLQGIAGLNTPATQKPSVADNKADVAPKVDARAAVERAKGKGLPSFKETAATGINTAGYDLPDVPIAQLDTPQGLSTLAALKQRRNAMKEAGVDTDFWEKRQAAIDEERKALGGEKEKAGWMALARAGLGMAAGKSPHALSNIAEGAMGGLDQYGRDTKEIKQDEKLLRQADQKLAEAKYMQDRGDADAAYAAMQKREDLINSTNIKNIELKQQAQLHKADLEGERSKTMFTQQQENIRHRESVQAQLAAAGAPSGTERVIDNIYAAMKAKNPNATYIDAYNQYNAVKGTSGLDDDKILAAWNDAGGLKGTKKTFKEYKAEILGGSSDKYSGWGQLQ